MTQHTTTTKIIERCQISPPSGSVPPTTVPLTFFDIPWLLFVSKRLFFFDFPHPLHHFTLTLLPNLKHSLSLALRHFFPFSAVLLHPPPPQKPYLLFSADGGSVSFNAAESTTDFDLLISNDPRVVTDNHPFVPTLHDGDTKTSHVLAVQVTVFPNSGVAIGLTFNHVAADGRAFNHFVKSWAFFCRNMISQGSPPVDLEFPPSHDRSYISDTYGLEPIYLKKYWSLTSASDKKVDTSNSLENIVRATFVITPAHIAKLKQFVSAQREALTWHPSTFVVAVAYTWVQIIKTREYDTNLGNDETCHLGFLADCRNQTGLEYTIPDTYFGNCLALCHVTLKRSEMVHEDGVFNAAKGIGHRINELREEPLRGAENWMTEFKDIPESESLVTVAASPGLKVYDTDFGFGRPRKSQTDVVRGIALAECKDMKGGIEIGLALDKDTMNIFNGSFQRGLELL